MRVAACFMFLVFAVPIVAAPVPSKSSSLDDSSMIAEKLLERISVVEQQDKIPFSDAIKYLQDHTGLTILVDTKALRDNPPAQAGGLPQTLNDSMISIPAMKNVRAETVLRKVLEQVDLDYVIMPDHISLTTTLMKDIVTGQARRLPDLYPAIDGEMTEVDRLSFVRTTPYMTISFKETSAADAFKEIATRAGRTIIISQAAADKAKSPISASLANVAFETAAASLAEAAGLRAFRTGNVVVIVTPERAKQVEEKSMIISRGGILQGASALPVDTTATETRVKELDEKVKKLTEELEKLRKKN